MSVTNVSLKIAHKHDHGSIPTSLLMTTVLHYSCDLERCHLTGRGGGIRRQRTDMFSRQTNGMYQLASYSVHRALSDPVHALTAKANGMVNYGD